MMGDQLGVRVEGDRQLAADLGRFGRDIPGAIQRENRGVGQRVIDKAMPRPASVGSGPGATPQPRSLLDGGQPLLEIVAGGPHRKYHFQPWGKTPTPRAGKRPFLRRSLERQTLTTLRSYLDAVAGVARRGGLTFKKG